jgi:hypothetical protein
MKHKVSVAFILIMAFIAATTLTAIPVRASPTTYYVNASTGNDFNTALQAQNPGTPWKTISHAISVAAATDTIIVAAGVYDEVLAVNKQLTLTGQAGAVIRPDSFTAKLDGGVRRPAVYITANGVTIQGFEIDGTTVTNQGIYGFNNNGLTIKNNNIHDMVNDADDVSGNGIIIFGWDATVNNNLISNNVVYNTARMGIFVGGMRSSDYYWLISNQNTISGNEVYHTWQGPTSDYGAAVQMNGAKNSAITNNNIHDTKAGTNYYGVYIYGSSTGNTILSNTVHDNTQGIVLWINPTLAAFGSDVPGAPEVHQNNIYHNSNYGVWNVNSPSPPLVVDATSNWWGDGTGPHHATSWLYLGNPYGPHLGLGDSVTNYVLYDPWLVPLTVVSAYDSPNPSGTTMYTKGTTVTASVTSPAGNEFCTGWTGTGSTPPSGATRTVTFTITQASTITWNWAYAAILGPSVGGKWAPITMQTLTTMNALSFVPWIILGLMAAASALFAYRRIFRKRL